MAGRGAGFRIWRHRLLKIETRTLTATVSEAGAAAQRPNTVSQINRNTARAARVKEYHDFRCQVCGERLLTPVGP